ncbi:MAG: dTDP-glucose 4,6-dehydratase [Chloroflexi bacterium]|nr:dTDP-glucose 4,6-dehydratase [Chloroflexota bacterium]MBL77180.1 dTDP-glucose 4,6-dehydratase [Chloroflexota bacterium]|tara:strand:- start:9515 stop:10501 length:987 start_codon:yes stop_codon:yes gene_type:complete
MKLLVTGGLGFIGSNFIQKMLTEYPNYEILNIDAEFLGSNKKNLKNIDKNDRYEYVKGNITNKKLMEELISQSDIVVNFAAESFVDRSISDPNPFLISNFRGTFTILDIITKQNKSMIQISTDEVFGSLQTGTADENSRFNPSSPYAATKAAAELLINSYCITYQSKVIITRCTNNFGPRQFAEKLIPKTIILANNNKKIPIYGTGSNIRDWMYVNDHCEAIHSVMLNGKYGESYNISSDNELDNITIVKKILEFMNKSEDLIEFVEDRPGHDFRYSMSSEKISRELKWNPKTKFNDGLENTIKWYLDNTDIWKDVSTDTLNSTPWKN